MLFFSSVICLYFYKKLKNGGLLKIEDKKMQIEYKNINEVIPYIRNPRDNTGAVEKVKASIKEFGFKVPIVIDRDNVIVTGHTRILAAKQLGMESVPVIYADDLSPEKIKAFRIADNKVSEYATWDEGLLSLELLDLDELGFDMSEFGFESFDDDEEEEKIKDKASEREIESMELKAFEHHDYIVFVFDNQMDWLNVCSEFKLKRVNAGYGTTKKIGVGRVVHGKRLLERLANKAVDPEQEQE